MTVRFRAAAGTHLGTVRMNNEDSAFASPDLLVLADGMGGHAAGEVASVVALRVFAELDHTPGADVGTNLQAAGRRARKALVAMSDADPVLESLGTTLIAVASEGDQVYIGHIGDSRVYLLREDSMYQVTTDHTHVQRMVDLGQITADQVRTHPYRAMLLKSLDDHPTGPDLDVIEVSLQAGDRLLLCSDGLSDYLSADEIGRALAVEPREEAVEALIEAALQAATRDNVTVVVADVEAGDSDEEPESDEPNSRYVGAVIDGIRLSDAAASALNDSVPELSLDPEAPWRGGPVGVIGDDDGEPGSSYSSPDQVVGEGVDADSGTDDLAEGAPVSAAVEGASDNDPGASDECESEGDADRVAEHTPALSPMPGVLAGTFVLAVLVFVAFMLFG